MSKNKSNFNRTIALIMTIIVSCSILVACSSGGSINASAETLIFAQSAEPRGLDPALVDDGESSKVINNIYEGLLKYSSNSTEIQPCLAESWEVSEDGLTYIFKLRQGVKFHDGTDFNAEAVKFNIDRQLPENATSDMSYSTFVYGSVESVDVMDEYTVKINMKEVCTPFLSNLAMSLSAPMVSPTALKNNNNNVNEAPVGTGAYKFVRWDKSQSIILERNDEYWGEKALTKNVLFKFIADTSARVVALNNGEVDMIDGIDTTVVEQIKSGSNTVFETDGMNINYMAYNMNSEILNKKEIRKAISQAINVPELVESLYQGYAVPATSILPSFIDGYDESITQVSYNPEQAKKVLSEAGVTSLRIMTYSNARPYNSANGQVLAEAIQGYLSKVGVSVTIDSYDWTTYKQKVKTGDFDICFYGWVGDNGDPDNFMNVLASTDPGMNVSRYNSVEFNNLVNKGLSIKNGDERNAIYTQLEKMLADEVVWLPISHSKILSAYRPNIQNYSYHVTGNISFSEVSKV